MSGVDGDAERGGKRERRIKKELRFLLYDLIASDPPTPVFLSITHRKFSAELLPLTVSVCVSVLTMSGK